MNELSLFSGAGGGLLATKHFLNWRTIGYVEQDPYCQNIITQRAKEGFLDTAPLWGDINEFIESGAVDQYEGVTDVVTGGWPCQPFSVAGRRRGKDDPRNCWPQCIEVIRRVKPRFFFGENVPGLLNSGYFPEILRSLAQAGYAARWIVLGCDSVGGNHRRKRLWLLAYSTSLGLEEHGHRQAGNVSQASEDVAYSSRPRLQARSGNGVGTEHRSHGNEGQLEGASSQAGAVAYADTGQRIEPQEQIQTGRATPHDSGEYVAHSVSDSEGSAHGSKVWRGFERWEDEDIKEWYEVGGNPTNFSGQWAIEPNVGRVAHGVASRVDRLKALGNGQVPLVADVAWGMLGGQELEEIRGV
tara:strand:+ start:1367 stop:2434 length:1068 start_codon:yes stop_codon:yes gene_type:complete